MPLLSVVLVINRHICLQADAFKMAGTMWGASQSLKPLESVLQKASIVKWRAQASLALAASLLSRFTQYH